MVEGYWVIRTYEAGRLGEKTKYFVPGTRPTRMTRKAKDEVKKQEQNEASAVKRLNRLIHANFHEGDLLLGLDYSDEGMRKVEQRARAAHEDFDTLSEEARADAIRAAAEHEARLVLRRVKRAMGDVPLRYILVTSDMDGDTGEPERVHHHLIVGAEAREAFASKWAALGGVSWRRLSAQDDYTPVAAYLLRQVRHIPDAKKYSPSRNLVRPEPRDRISPSGAELRVPKGAKLLYRAEYKPGAPQYIRYVRPRETDAGNHDREVHT